MEALFLIDTTAFVLQFISRNMPSFAFTSEIRSHIQKIRVADSNLFHSRPVHILIGTDLYLKIQLERTLPRCCKVSRLSMIVVFITRKVIPIFRRN